VVTNVEERAHVRLPHLDNLRTVLVAWVIGGHAVLGYSSVGGWAYEEVREVTFSPVTELVLIAILGPTGLFVIGVFFFVAGLLTERAVARHGPRLYARDRVLRLGLPWLASALLVWPASVWLAYSTADRRVSFWWVFSHRDPLLGSGPLWFALVLLLYSVAFALSRRLLRDPRHQSGRPLTAAHLAGVVVLIAVCSFVVRLWFPARSSQIGDLHLWQWPQCIGLFVLGVTAARHGWARHVPDRVRRACGAVTLATLVPLPVLAVARLRDFTRDVGPYLGGWHWEALATATIEGILVVAGSVWLVGVAERRLVRGGRRATGWARSAFAAFVIQGPILLAFAGAARVLDAPAEIKASLVGAAGIMVSFWLGRRLPFLSDSGRRRARYPAAQPRHELALTAKWRRPTSTTFRPAGHATSSSTRPTSSQNARTAEGEDVVEHPGAVSTTECNDHAD
jgi:Acyltransferase family